MSYGMWRTPRSICFKCRRVYAVKLLDKWHRWTFTKYDRKCPECGNIMKWVFDWRPPKRNNKKAWKEAEKILNNSPWSKGYDTGLRNQGSRFDSSRGGVKSREISVDGKRDPSDGPTHA